MMQIVAVRFLSPKKAIKLTAMVLGPARIQSGLDEYMGLRFGAL